MYRATEVKQNLLYEVAGGQLTDEQLIEMMGEEEFKAMRDNDEEEEGKIPTLVYDLMGDNIFIKFKSRKEGEEFLSRLASMLAESDDEFAITCPGKIVPFRETWEDESPEA